MYFVVKLFYISYIYIDCEYLLPVIHDLYVSLKTYFSIEGSNIFQKK